MNATNEVKFYCSETHDLMVKHQKLIEEFRRLKEQSRHYVKHAMVNDIDDIISEAGVILIDLKKSHTSRVSEETFLSFKATVSVFERLLVCFKKERDIAHAINRNPNTDISRFL